MTALSRGRVFAEVVPADLVTRTVRLAISPGPIGVLPDPSLPANSESSEIDLPQPLETLRYAGRRLPSATRLGTILSLFLAFSLSLVVGTCMAVLSTGGSLSDIQAIFPMRFPSRDVSKLQRQRSLQNALSPTGDAGTGSGNPIESEMRHCTG